MNQRTILKLADDVTFQSLGKNLETAILSLETGTLYSCNQTTESFLKILDGQRNFAATIELLLDQYDVSRPVLAADLLEVAEKLVDEGLVLVVGECA